MDLYLCTHPISHKQLKHLLFHFTGSAALPSNMAFLASGREKEPSDMHLTSCFSTNHRTAAEGKNMSMFSRTTGTHLLTWLEDWPPGAPCFSHGFITMSCPFFLLSYSAAGLKVSKREAWRPLLPFDSQGPAEEGEREKRGGAAQKERGDGGAQERESQEKPPETSAALPTGQEIW